MVSYTLVRLFGSGRPNSQVLPRALVAPIRRDLEERIVLVSGPRQSGKTTLSRSLGLDHDYFNYDAAADRVRLANQSWDRGHEIDFFVSVEGRPPMLIEAKWSDAEPTRSFASFEHAFGHARRLQLVRKPSGSDRTYPSGIEVRTAAPWLASLEPSLLLGERSADA